MGIAVGTMMHQVKTSALESTECSVLISVYYYSAGVAGSTLTQVACNFPQAIGQSTEHTVLTTSSKGKPKFEYHSLDANIRLYL